MPHRSTPFQAIVHLVRRQFAEPGVQVTESKMLHDARLDIDREVDIVVEGTFDGEPVVTSVEVIERKRRADITWVEQQIKKHQYLPSNRLVLVSESGFYSTALDAVGKEGGWVEALQPTFIEVDGQLEVETLYADLVQLTPTIHEVEVLHPDDGEPLRVRATSEIGICDQTGVEIGTALQLAMETLNLPVVLKAFNVKAHNHPKRDELKSFTCEIPIDSLDYHLRRDPENTLHHIYLVYLTGHFEYAQYPMPFASRQLGTKRFGAGSGMLFGRPGAWIRVVDEATGKVTISWQVKIDPDKPIGTVFGPPRFPGLLTLEPPLDNE